jgi:hypothetical protein
VLHPLAFTSVATPYGIDLAYLKRQFSNPLLGNFPGTAIPAGSSVEDNAKLFKNHTWDMVAAYRPVPQLSPPQLTFAYSDCWNHQIFSELSWGSTDPIFPLASFVVERQNPITGVWTPVTEGGPQCYLVQTSVQGVTFRVKRVLEGLLESLWAYLNVTGICQSEDPPGGGGEW